MISPSAAWTSTVPVRENAIVVSIRDVYSSRSRCPCAAGAAAANSAPAAKMYLTSVRRIVRPYPSRARSGAHGQQRGCPHQLDLLLERIVELFVEEGARGIAGQRGPTLPDRLIDDRQIALDHANRGRVEQCAALVDDVPQASDLPPV